MTNKPVQQNKDQLKSNIKLQPSSIKNNVNKSINKPFKAKKIGLTYFLTWGGLAALSVGGLSVVIVQQGGIDDAIQIAKFKNINRQVALNRLPSSDKLATAAIPNTKINKEPILPEAVAINAVKKPLDFQPYVKDGAKTSVIMSNNNSFSAFLGRSDNKNNIINLWYGIKREQAELVSDHKAAYYFDKETDQYNLLVGNFSDLNQVLKFCAQLKFYDIACKYNHKYTDIQTSMIN